MTMGKDSENVVDLAQHPGHEPVEAWKDPGVKPLVEIRGLSKHFDDVVAVDDVSLKIYEKELFSILGGSGSGKSTLLRMLAGFETPTGGEVLIDGQDMTSVPPYERPVNMMFQSYALFPHMSVEKNIAFGLKQEKLPRAEIAERVEEVLRLVQLTPFRNRKPQQLSGGQRQRVALARSLVKKPKLLLLDEPLGALDKKLREQTQFELMNIQEQLGITFIIVTHDQEEAMTVSSRIAVMDQGRIAQVATPTQIYETPNSRFVAEFVGDVNMFEGQIEDIAADHIDVHSTQAGTTMRCNRAVDADEGTRVWVAIRPEKLDISKKPPEDPEVNCMQGEVWDIGYLGNMYVYHVRLDSGKMVTSIQANRARLLKRAITWEDRVYLSWRTPSSVLLVN